MCTSNLGQLKRRTIPENGDRPDTIATDYGIGMFGTVGTLTPP